MITYPAKMKTTKFAKWFFPVLLLTTLSSCLSVTKPLSPHQQYGKNRVSAMFEALKEQDYETAWKYWDPQGEWSVKRFKKILQNGNISKVDNFEIMWVHVDEFKTMPPWITVYVQINKKDKPAALLVQYDELIFYAAHSIYE